MKMLFDTSALYKRYSEEAGRDRVQALLARASSVVLAAHCKTEIASAMCRDLLNEDMTAEQYRQSFAVVTGDFEDFAVAPISAQVEALAIAAMESNRLRAMDALHIGTAQAAKVDLFVTADRRQAAAARAGGLETELIEAGDGLSQAI